VQLSPIDMVKLLIGKKIKKNKKIKNKK